jgi:hypothetical protein
MDKKRAVPLPSDLIAGPRWAPGRDALARLRAVTSKTPAMIFSDLRGSSMGAAVPDGARIRIRTGLDDSWHLGTVIAFLAGSRLMAHRIVYEGRRGFARHFVLTQGDRNWLCDPPVNRSTVVGEVEAFLADGEWRAVAAARVGFYRRLVARLSQTLMSLALEWNPAFAIQISHPISRLRMGPRLVLLKLRRYAIGHARS